MLLRERRGQLVELAVHDRVDLVERHVDPVIGDAPLRKVVRADPLAAVAAPDERLAHRRLLLLALAPLAIEQPRREHRHRLRAVAVLRAVVLALDDEAGGQVRDPHRGIGLVDVLAPRAGRAERVDPDVRRIDVDVGDRIGLRHHGDRARGRVDAPLRLGFGHALHAVAARFELELRVGARPDDAQDDFLVAAELGRRFRDDLDPPAIALGVARVHPAEAAGEERRLVAARAGADFDEDIALVVRVLRQQHALQVAFERGHSRRGLGVLLVGKGLHFRIARHLAGRGEVAFRPLVIAESRDDGLDLGPLAVERPVAIEVAHDLRRGEHGVELREAMRQRFELGAQRGFHG